MTSKKTTGRRAKRKPIRTERKPGLSQQAQIEWPVDEEGFEIAAKLALEEPTVQEDETFDPDERMESLDERHRRLAADVPCPTDVLSARRKKAFLMSLASSGNVTIASSAAGWPRSFAYSVRKADPKFAEQWANCLEVAADLLEEEARRRAIDGVEETVYGSGGKDVGTIAVGTRKVYSDPLLRTLLQATRPEKFRERHEVAAADGQKGGVLVIPAAVPLDQFEAAAAAQQAQFREKRDDT